MSNKITFTTPGKVKLSWKVYHNSSIVEDGLDSVKVFANGLSHVADPSKDSFEMDVDQDTTFSINVKYNGLSANSDSLMADYIGDEIPDTPKPPTKVLPCYYGTVVTDINYTDEYGDLVEWNTVKSQYDEFIATLNDETIKIMIDASPIEETIAHPNTLVSSTSITPNDYVYNFICKDETVKKSHPIVIYPSSYGVVSAIKNALGTNADINTDTMNGFYMLNITLDNEEYIVYIQKQAASNSTKAQLTFVK